MSAYVVDKTTIDRIVVFIRSTLKDEHHKWDVPRALHIETDVEARNLGQKMWELNQEAVRQKYGEDYEIVGEPVVYRSIPKDGVLSPPIHQVLKSLHCLTYQMAEGDIPKRPLYQALDKFASNLANRIATQTPEYDAADWG